MGRDNINIILIGMPGSGKTAIGKILSQKLNYSFMDTDESIIHNENMTIKEIFKCKGEEYFRQLEKRIVDDIMCMDKRVISTGGGLPAFYNNIDKLNNAGITIFLDVPLEILITRNEISNDRPLLQNNIKEKLIELYKKRLPIYNKAHIKIDNYNKSIEAIGDYIINSIMKYKK
ncbi:shikimate kinase [Clostridium lundense]|uniref:shikimate kinase n=1 Tax=Clostridium lundense TaxID=319475 RepID=UPI0004892A92|nr:shikimate kinase [Clostridium lundense]